MKRNGEAFELLVLAALLLGVVFGFVVGDASGYHKVDADLREIQRQRDAWELYTERWEQ